MAVVKTGSGWAIVCGPRKPQKCAYCGQPGTQLCDFKVNGETGETCNRPMCIKHAKRVAFQTDYCREHSEVTCTSEIGRWRFSYSFGRSRFGIHRQAKRAGSIGFGCLTYIRQGKYEPLKAR